MAASRETFFEPFGGEFRSRARKALRGERSVDLPHVRARPLDDPAPDELAEFRAGALAAPARGAKPEPWQIEGVLFRNPKGPPIVGDLTVRHFPLDKKAARVEVTGTVLRALPLGTIRDKARAGLEGIWQARDTLRDLGYIDTSESVERAREAAQEAKKRRPGRPGHPDEYYRRIAARYLQLAKVRGDVLVALADEESELQGRQIPRETIRDWVRKATERGYLAPGKPGRAEVRPGPKLKRKEK